MGFLHGFYIDIKYLSGVWFFKCQVDFKKNFFFYEKSKYLIGFGDHAMKFSNHFKSELVAIAS